jgi:hypothetical protein
VGLEFVLEKGRGNIWAMDDNVACKVCLYKSHLSILA